MRTEVLTTKQAAARLGLSQQRVQQLIAGGKLLAQMMGGNYIVYADDLASLKVYGKPGRPKKAAVNGAPASAPAQVNGTGAAEQPAATAPTAAGVKGNAGVKATAGKVKAGENAAQAKAKAKAGKGKGRKAAKKKGA